MGQMEVDRDSKYDQYVIALYFVSTTLSTCGFGEISATKHDATECSIFLILQFVGLLFYSYTINEI